MYLEPLSTQYSDSVSGDDSSRDVSRATTPVHQNGILPLPTGGTPTTGNSKAMSCPTSPQTSPESGRRYWHRKLLKMKEELDRVGSGFRRRASTAARRLSPSIKRRSTASTSTVDVLSSGGLTVQIVRDAGHSSMEHGRSRRSWSNRSRTSSCRRSTRHKSDDRRIDDDLDFAFSSMSATAGGYGYTASDRSQCLGQSANTTTGSAGGCGSALPATASLLLNGLRDGRFSAHVPLDWLQPSFHGDGGRCTDGAGADRNLTVRIRDYRLEFYAPRLSTPADVTQPSPQSLHTGTQSSKGKASQSKSSAHVLPGRLIYCGAVSLPIYVDPTSVDFQIGTVGMPDGNITERLDVEGWMKGCSIRQNLNVDEVRISSDTPASNRKKPLSASASDVTLLAAPPSGGSDKLTTSTSALRPDDSGAIRRMTTLSVGNLETAAV